MVDFELLVGSDAFLRRVQADCQTARQRLFVQAMSFEGDDAGQAVAAAILSSPAAERRVLVDDYSRLMISDRPVSAARADAGLANEVTATDAMFQALIAAGVAVAVTNPVGWRFWRYPARNHKKLIVVDDVAYVGGINFSDHNFAWHDFMLRIEGAPAADFLAADFLATFAGNSRSATLDLGHLCLYALDGLHNRMGFKPVLDLIDRARSQITVISPYLSFPFTDHLSKAAARGVAVQLITPLANNKRLVRDSLLHAAQQGAYDVKLLADMSHLKGMLIDRSSLIVGSSNFDFVSLAAEEEYLAIITAPQIIDAFCAQIIDPAVAEALPPSAIPDLGYRGGLAALALRTADRYVQLARKTRRGVTPWTSP